MFFKRPKFTLNSNFLSDNIYEDVLLAFNKLKQSNIKINKDKITLFYPGCSCDIIRPLLLLDSLCNFKKADVILSDQFLSPETIAETMSSLTGIKRFRKTKEKHIFRFKNKTIKIIYKECDSLLEKNLPDFDIYFERAFQLFRKDNDEFIQNIIKRLNKDGLFISDFIDFKNKDLEELKIPKELNSIGFYKKFGILRKL